MNHTVALPRQDEVDVAVATARGLVQQAKDQYATVKTFCLFSGGNDSATLLHIVKDLIDAAVHIDTGIGIPQTLDFVRNCTQGMGVPLIVEHTPPERYKELVLAYGGFPGPAMHWLFYRQLKERRLDDLKRREIGRRGKDKLLLLSGMRLSESQRRKLYISKTGPIHPAAHSPRLIFCSAIQHFTPELLMAYRAYNEVPRSPVADLLHMSGECLCGVYAHPGELKEIELWFPEVAARIRALEECVHQAGIEQPRCIWGNGGGKRRGGKQVGVLCQSCEAR